MKPERAIGSVWGIAALAAAAVLVCGSANATLVDLTSAGATGTVNGAIYTQDSFQSSGTGMLNSFERIQADGTEDGYNTSGSNVLDNKPSLFTRDVLLSEAQIVNVSGTDYLEFVLDADQSANNPLLSLNDLQIFQTSTPGQSVTSFTGGVLDLANSTLVYRLDAGSDSTVALDASLSAGSGGADMTLLVPASVFDFGSSQGNLVLYSSFGDPNGSNAGFEEWALVSNCNVVPEPASMSLLGIGIAVVAAQRFFRKEARS